MLAGLFGAVTAIPFLFFLGYILRLVGAQPDVANQAIGYFQLFMASAPLAVMSAVTTAAFRSLNDSRTPMLITIGAVALNTVLGIFLVLGLGPFPKFGVLGAGIATLISQTSRCVILLVALYRRREGPHWKWPWAATGIAKIFRPLLEITYPLALSQMLWGTSAFVYTIVFTRLGTSVSHRAKW